MLTPSVEALIQHLADGKFHSGKKLADTLQTSRTTVWKSVQSLQALGLEIQAVKGRGYRLTHPWERLNAEQITASIQVPEACPPPVVEVHDCLNSTNAHLLRTASLRPAASICLAEMQTAGRGRLGRNWVSPFGANIYLSLLWRFRRGESLGGLSLAVGVETVRVLRKLGLADLRLKWPNDILWQERKLGGILIEAITESQGQCVVVVGLGLNLRLPPGAADAIDQPWVDIRTILGGGASRPDLAVPSRNRMAGDLSSRLLALLNAYGSEGLTPWLEDWRRWNCVLGRRVTVDEIGQRYEATAVNVTEEGSLVLRRDDGRRRLLAAGDVRLRVRHDA
ncbi:MAG: bifunctional biotin--[acetyl-CoA-carboxylase] ligase/biotin operon repressor BirA [Methylohalobius crimeensis]